MQNRRYFSRNRIYLIWFNCDAINLIARNCRKSEDEGFQHRLGAEACVEVDNVSLSDYRYYFASLGGSFLPFVRHAHRGVNVYRVWSRFQLKVSNTWQCGNRHTWECIIWQPISSTQDILSITFDTSTIYMSGEMNET